MKSREIRDNDRKNYRYDRKNYKTFSTRANLIFGNIADITKRPRIDKIYTHRQNESYVFKNRIKQFF